MTEFQINELIRELFQESAMFIEIIQDEYSYENRNADFKYENQIYEDNYKGLNQLTVCSEC